MRLLNNTTKFFRSALMRSQTEISFADIYGNYIRIILKWLITNIVIGTLIYLLLAYYPDSQLFSYELHKLLHIFGAVIFLGNIIVTGVWMLLAEHSKNPSVIRFASKAVIRTDTYFTKPGVMCIILNGLLLASKWGGVYQTSWIAGGLALLMLSGIVWGGFLVRYQRILAELSHKSAEAEAQLSDEFFQVLHKWYYWGILAIILPLISLGFMVVKPKFW